LLRGGIGNKQHCQQTEIQEQQIDLHFFDFFVLCKFIYSKNE